MKKKLTLDDFAIYSPDGIFKGYFVTDIELDAFAVENNVASKDGEHTKKARYLFLRTINAKSLTYMDFGEYKINQEVIK